MTHDVDTLSCATVSELQTVCWTAGKHVLAHLGGYDALNPCSQLSNGDGPLGTRQVRQHIGIHAIAICPAVLQISVIAYLRHKDTVQGYDIGKKLRKKRTSTECT